MKLYAKVEVKNIELSELMMTFKRPEVLSYCQRCDQYGRNYSCPDHMFDEKTMLNEYAIATLILTEIDSAQLKGHEYAIETLSLQSRVLEQHQKKQSQDTIDPYAALAMYIYDAVKEQMSDRLLDFENQQPDTVGLPPGSCTRCPVCLKSIDKPCIHPETIRYSLESLGFKVSDVYNQFFGRSLEWTSDELPKTYQTCSAILSKSPIEKTEVMDFFDDLTVEIPI